ncbi:MAG TPA: hypothetical protein VMM14_08490 [Acidimicrobiia bacterium]|nr:hypothetical protein [Acidimicrobiia bacterium]
MNRITSLLTIVPFLALALWLSTRSRVFFGAFLIGHALVHVMYFVPQPPADQSGLEWPFRLDSSWALSGIGLSSQTIRVIGAALAILAVGGFLATGIGLLLDVGWWTGVAVVAAITSLLLMATYTQPLILLGLVIDLFVLSMVWLRWLPTSIVLG